MGKIPIHLTKIFKTVLLSIALLCCFTTEEASGRDVTLAGPPDPSVDGYKLYYKPGTSGPPYGGTGAAEGNSPVDVGYVSEFTLRGLSDDEDYYFSITAYNQHGESGYSNEVTTARSVAVSSGGTGGGGGGGCFIAVLQ
jgi:hypothetical protein